MITHSHTGHVGPDLLYDARAFVAQYAIAIATRVRTTSGIKIGMADATSLQLDEDFASLWRCEGDTLNNQRLSELFQYCGADFYEGFRLGCGRSESSHALPPFTSTPAPPSALVRPL